MSDRIFLDTNMLIYLYSENEPVKCKRTRLLLDTEICVTSVQALNEAVNVWLKKYKLSMEKVNECLDNIELICDEVVTIQRKAISKAILLKERYGYSYYDCLMLASALESNCETIYTEDMSNNQIIDGKLKISNPFSA